MGQISLEQLKSYICGEPVPSMVTMREAFIEWAQTQPDQLDQALLDWFTISVGEPMSTHSLKVVWASHLQEIFTAMLGHPLPKVAHYFRDHLSDIRAWLRPLRDDESLDPEQAFLSVLAWSVANQSLERFWRDVIFLRTGEVASFVDVGLLGLIKARDPQGQVPPEASYLLLASLVDLADRLPHPDWCLTVKAILGGYSCNLPNWRRRFHQALKIRPEAQNGPLWLKQLFDSLEAPSK